MVNYNAFNVDPNKYQQQAMGNFSNAMQIRNQNQQAADRNALYKQQQADLQEQRKAQNAFEAQRVGELQKRTVLQQQQLEQEKQQDQYRRWGKGIEIALQQKTTDGANAALKNIAPVLGLEDVESFSFTNVNPTQSTGVIKTAQGDVEITAPTKNFFPVVEKMTTDPTLANNPELMGKFLADNGASLKPYTAKEKDDGFTLGEGQIRYDKNGNIIAKGTPKKDKEESTKPIYDRNVELALAANNIQKTKTGGYEQLGFNIDGEETWVPASKENAQWAAKTEREQRYYTSQVLKFKKELEKKYNDTISYEDAGYEFEQRRAEERAKKAARDAAFKKSSADEQRFKRIDRGGPQKNKQKFDPEGNGYDMESAKAAGLKPDSTGHWPSRDPKTGLLLKGRGHKTWKKTIAAEKAAGYEVYKGDDGRYYSRKKKKDMWENYQEESKNAFKGAGLPESLMQDLPKKNVMSGMPKPYNARFR
jgi:hypothetical protein